MVDQTENEHYQENKKKGESFQQQLKHRVITISNILNILFPVARETNGWIYMEFSAFTATYKLKYNLNLCISQTSQEI